MAAIEIKVFSTDRDYLDEIAWKSDPDIVAARRFFYSVRHHAEAETPIDVIF
jgi:hypothetical protein